MPRHLLLFPFLCALPSPSNADTLDPIKVTAPKTVKQAQVITSLTTTQATRSGSDRLEDFADYVPGVSIGRQQAGIGSEIYVRGYALNGNFTLDGLPDVQGFYLRDPATIEQLDITKGRNSVLFGSGTPGGTANYLTKKPQFQTHRQINLALGSPDQQRLSLDATGTLKHPDWAGRLVIAGQKAQTERANVGDDRITVMPSLLWQTAQQSLLLEAEHGWQNREYDFDNVFYRGKPVYNVSYVDPRSFADRRITRLGVTHQRDWGKGWSNKLQASQIDAKRDERWIGFGYLPTTGSTLPGHYRDTQSQQQQQAWKAELSKDYRLGNTAHTTTVGAAKQRVAVDLQRQFSNGAFNLDIFDPRFDFALPAASTLRKRDFSTLRREQGYYLQHQAQLGDTINITAGVRKSRFQGNYTDNLFPINSLEDSNNQALTHALGATWQLTPNWQALANHTESFEPNAGLDKNDQFVAPRQGKQQEIGLRYQRPSTSGKPLRATASTYRIRQHNVTEADPTTTGAIALLGDTQTKGVELSLDVPVNAKLALNGGYAYTDAHITRSSDTAKQGKRLHNVAQHSGSIAMTYAPNERTEAFAGVVRVGKRQGDSTNSFSVPAYTRVDAGINWKLNRKTTLKTGVRNLLDEDYVAATEGIDFIVQGRKRTVTVGIEIDF